MSIPDTNTKTNTQTNMAPRRQHGFTLGLMAGTCVGAGLVMWLAPKAGSELRRRISESAKRLGERTSAGYENASASATAAVGEVARRAQDVGDDVAVSVARVAREVSRAAEKVERIAISATGDRK